MKDKPWYKSKTVLAGLAIAVVGVLQSFGVDLPYEAAYTVLGSFGIYGVRTAIAENAKK